jgi:hypothetical protein
VIRCTSKFTESFVRTLLQESRCLKQLALFNWILSLHPKNIRSKVRQTHHSVEALVILLQAPLALRRFIYWKSDHRGAILSKETDPEDRRKMEHLSKFLNLLTGYSFSKVIY